MDNPFVTPTAGQGDWDSSLNGDLTVLERGYHTTERAGMAINTGHVLWLNSGGYFFHFDPNSADIFPTHFAYTGASSGDSFTALAWGTVRSLGITSPAVPGKPLYVSTQTPGVVVAEYAGADRKIGWGLTGYGVLFNPSKNKSPLDVTITQTFQCGAAVNTGHALWQKTDLTVVHFNPNSESIQPIGLSLNGGTGVGSIVTVLMKGMVRSLGINSAVPASAYAYVSALTPGVLVGSYGGSFRRMGLNVSTWALLIDPMEWNGLPEQITTSLAISAVTGSLHLFTLDAGRWGINHQTVMIGNSADLVELKFFSDSGRSTLLYQTKSGGVTVVGSFQDRALWPYDNSDAVNSATLYGSLKIMSAAAVGSDTISVRGIWDRTR